MEQACANNNIGYDQNQRTTLYTKAKAANWDLSKITEKCECDCSALVAVCVNAAGISVSKDIYTGNQKDALKSTGKFNILTESKYLVKADYLERGDIILGSGHTAVVLSNSRALVEDVQEPVNKPVNKPVSNNQAKVDTASSFDKTIAGTYETTTMLNVRCGAGTSKKILVVIPKSTKVRCYGYYTKYSGTNWLYVQFTYKNVVYTGFASAKYLIKK